jgi:type I restriction enzyme S subunit
MYEFVGAADWARSSLYSLAGWRNGLAFQDIDFAPTGRPIIKIAELKNGVTAQTARTMAEYDRSVFVGAGDMLFSWSGNPDTSIDVFRWRGEDGWLNQHIFKITPRAEVSDEFFFFLLRWLKPRFAEIARNKQTTGLGHVTVKDLKEITVGVPLPAEQDAIIAVLSPIDDKIELNRRMNETLEAMARGIFRDWFVDFGPTRAKMAGASPYLAPDVWKLFPDGLDAKGKPEGWREVPLDEVADFLDGLALQKFPGGADDLPVIKIAELRSGVTEKSGRASRSVPEKYVVRDGDVLFSWSGSLTQVLWSGGEGALNQHLFKVTSKQFPKWLHYLWVDHHLPKFQEIAASKATTMGHIQRHHLAEAKTNIAGQRVMDAANAIIGPLFDRILANALDSRTLAQTRDLLLPKLMSGEIRLRDAERVLEDAA